VLRQLNYCRAAIALHVLTAPQMICAKGVVSWRGTSFLATVEGVRRAEKVLPLVVAFVGQAINMCAVVFMNASFEQHS
jgi:hypothetical protein